MTTLRHLLPLAWKECHEQRVCWYVGAGLIVVLPLFVGLHLGLGGPYLLMMGVPAILGGVFAVLCALSATCRDLEADPASGVEAFWRSRPISAGGLATVKFVVGLLVVVSVMLLAAGVLLGLALGTFDLHALQKLDTYSTIVLLNPLLLQTAIMLFLYAAAFAAGALTARAIPAIFLALFAALILYFLPLLLPPLAWLDLLAALLHPFNMSEQRPTLSLYFSRILLTMLGLSALLGALGIGAMAQSLRFSPRPRTMAWMTIALLLLMLLVAGLQIGNHLQPQRVLPLTESRQEVALELYTDGLQGIVHTVPAQNVHFKDWRREFPLSFSSYDNWRIRPLDFQQIPLVSQTVQGIPTQWHSTHLPLLWHPQSSQRITRWKSFPIGTFPEWEARRSLEQRRYGLWGFDTFDLSTAKPIPGTTRSLAELFDSGGVFPSISYHDRHQLALVSPGRPGWENMRERPAYLVAMTVTEDHTLTVQYRATWSGSTMDRERIRINQALQHGEGRFGVLRLPGWELAARMQLSLNTVATSRESSQVLNDRHLVRYSFRQGVEVFTYTVDPPSATGEAGPTDVSPYAESVHIRRIGHRPPSPLERLTSSVPIKSLAHQGLLWVLVASPQPGVIVFDVRDPRRPRKLGHYTAPNELFLSLAATPDGKVIVGGRDLHVFDTAGW